MTQPNPLELTRRGATVREAPKVIAETAEYLRLEVCVYDAGQDLEIPTGLTPGQLRKVAEKYVGQPITDMAHIDGFGAPRRIGVVVKSWLDGQRVLQWHDYWPAAPDDPNLWRELREVKQGYSIHWRETVECRMECSKCGQDVGRALDFRWVLESWPCGHEMGKDGVKALYTDVNPVEVARTYLPGCGGTGVIKELRTRARAYWRAQRQERTVPTVTVTPAPGALTIDWSPVEGASSYDILISTTAGADEASAEVITGATRPHTYVATPGTTYYVRVRANTEAGAEMSDEVSAVPLANQPEDAGDDGGVPTTPEGEQMRTRMQQLEQRLAETERRAINAEKKAEASAAESFRTKRVSTLRGYRRSGHLSGNDDQLLKATSSRCSHCGKEHPLSDKELSELMARVTPAEPRPTTPSSFGPDESDPSAALPAPRDGEDIDQAAKLLASRDKISEAEARRRVVNSLAPRIPRN